MRRNHNQQTHANITLVYPNLVNTRYVNILLPFLGPPSACVGAIRVIRVTRNMLAIYWRPPTDNGGSPIERYIVEKREADRSHWTSAGRCPPGTVIRIHSNNLGIMSHQYLL